MISHSHGCATYHREQRGIKTPEQRIEQLEADAKANEEQFWNLSKEIIALKAVIAEQKEKHAAVWKSLIEDNNYLRGELNAARARVATEG